ncbi:hypothetical protein [Legionella sp. CNM-4043-24]|uniref:hypothetical protein n=1 Tax=Legionella sp. CNM-4043-24 TaxID=3421646 RepID=UPI00403AD22A
MSFTKVLFLAVLLGIGVCHAEETDQFTLPPGELADIGPAASSRLYDVLGALITKTNTDIRNLQADSRQSRHTKEQLALRQKDVYLADQLYQKTGPGFPRWMRWNRLPDFSQPKYYKESRPWKTVYWLVFSQSPLFVVGLAPTVNMYGYYFGTDKLGHFFMQGHTYYKMYRYWRTHGKSPQQAHDAIVFYGQLLEQSYLGTLINGVYSNGDLSANYAGWKFYMNLAHPVKIGDKTLAPILVLKDHQWQFSPHINRYTLLRPYISDHLNEAFNPCRYSFMRWQIKRQVKSRCSVWIERYGITPKLIDEKRDETRLWHGEEYGHWLPKSNEISLSACFS